MRSLGEMSYNKLIITEKQAEKILLQHYGITAKASKLPGELDFNFRVKIEGQVGYILKISRPEEDRATLTFQQELLRYLQRSDQSVIVPKLIKDQEGNAISVYIDEHGNNRMARLLSWVSGRIWSSVNPQLNELRHSLGEQSGLLTATLLGFDHPGAHRSYEWDVASSLWIKEYIDLFDGQEKQITTYFINLFEANQSSYLSLRKSVVHNDPNDNNIIVSNDLRQPEVKALIDYGDAIYTQTINDLAIACAYAVMNHNDPLDAALPVVKGYHTSFNLEEEELVHLYCCIAMRLLITVTKSALNKVAEPHNDYLLVSEVPAWEVLYKWYDICEKLAHYSFREACGYCAHPDEEKFRKWSSSVKYSLEELFPTVQMNDIHLLDLSISSQWIGHQEDFNNLDLFQYKIEQLQKDHPDKIISGGYLEPRPIYTSAAYDKIGNSGRESRTFHLGVDFWLPALTPIHAVLDGEVVVVTNDEGDKGYGGLVILKHDIVDLTFYSLYGHNTVTSAFQHQVGDRLKKGDKISVLGNYPENGNWAPHLHFQIMLSMLDFKDDFPGVAYHNQLSVWKSLCPDPNLLFKNDRLLNGLPGTNEELINYRKQHLGKSLSLQYKVPIKMVRGAGQYLIDQNGKKYLDTVNNVAHVGHEHYSVVNAGQAQMSLINTNSRYLHGQINKLTKELLSTLPPELSVLHFVNSGSEANELAIRMAKAVTGQKDVIASEVGYHGNTNMCVDISSYKFDGNGGGGAPEHTHIFPLPDSFRGKYRGDNSGIRYAEEVQHTIECVHAKSRGLAAFIIEPIISCGGQIVLPNGFLPKAYAFVKAAGGMTISDEVQVGCGRMGKTFWGFELYGVLPDIVTIGKPLGNGHPLAAVACTKEVANLFANGMEYFNTFGGNPVSCAIGAEVLQTVKRENLQKNALEVGAYLKSELKQLAIDYPIIGDVRGEGLFLGIELVDQDLNPLADHADYLINRMKYFGILMSTDGPDHNVIKIKPPMVFDQDNADELIHYMKKILAENFMLS